MEETLLLRCKQKIRSFLGLWNVCCSFVHSFAYIASPPNKLSREDLWKLLTNLVSNSYVFFWKPVKAFTRALISHLSLPYQTHSIIANDSDIRIGCFWFKRLQKTFVVESDICVERFLLRNATTQRQERNLLPWPKAFKPSPFTERESTSRSLQIIINCIRYSTLWNRPNAKYVRVCVIRVRIRYL